MLNKIFNYALTGSLLLGTAFVGITKYRDLLFSDLVDPYSLLHTKSQNSSIVRDFTKSMLRLNLLWNQDSTKNKYYNKINLFGTQLKNPVGLASGYDINGQLIEGLQKLGFGFIEIGSVSLVPFQNQQQNNITQDDPQIYQNQESYMGLLFTKVLIQSLRIDQKITVPLGVSILPSEDVINYSPFLMENDFQICYRELINYADFVVLNLIGSNSINPHYQQTGLNDKEFIQTLFTKLNEVIQTEQQGTNIMPQVFVKIPSNVGNDTLDHLLQQKFDGIILQKDGNQTEVEYLKMIKQISLKTNVISVGGIRTSEQIDSRINSGAKGVQVLSPMIIEGPSFMKKIISSIN